MKRLMMKELEDVEADNEYILSMIDEEEFSFDYKNHIYSLKECKEFISNISSSIEYSENEGILTSCLHYLGEYLEILKNEY